MPDREFKVDAFYWVLLRPYPCTLGSGKTYTPGWEPMQRGEKGWHRCGVIYVFKDEEVQEVGEELIAKKEEATREPV